MRASSESSRLLVGLVILLAVRAVDAASGLQFDAGSLDAWQYIDPVLLHHHLLQSVFYDAAQPPLFNLFLGGVLKLSGDHWAIAFQALYTLGGALVFAAVYPLARKLGVRPWLALTCSLAYVCSPSFVLYEQWLSYGLPLTLLVAASALALAQFLETRKSRWLAATFALLAALCLIHNLFHAAVILVIGVGLIARHRLPARPTLLAAGVAFALVLSVYAKNAVLFGQLSSSSWMGMNLAQERVESIPLAMRQQLVSEGKVSPAALARPFSSLDDYPADWSKIPPRYTYIPVLAALRKSSGSRNLHSYPYILISKRYLADERYLFLHYPGVVAESLGTAISNDFDSLSSYFLFEPNRARSVWMAAQCWFFERVLGLRIGDYRFSPVLAVLIPWIVWHALRRARRKEGASGTTPALLEYCVFLILYVAGVGTLFNPTENERLRAMTDPLSVVLFAFWLERWVLPRLRSLHGAPSSTAAA